MAARATSEAEADRLCDRIAIMDHGGVIDLDTARALRRLLPADGGLELILETAQDPLALFTSRPTGGSANSAAVALFTALGVRGFNGRALA